METDKKRLVVVTGGAGFVGSHLCERLVNEGFAVISLDNYFTGTPDNHVEGVAYRTGHTKDIAYHIPESPDIVFHLGEYARTEKSFEDMELVWDLNKTGTFAVLEFCRRRHAKIIYAGSSTKFADGGDGRDQSPYAWTKATNTELVKNYAEWFGIEYAITYFYNVYGPREMSGSYGTVIKIFSDLYKNGQPLTVTSPGTQSRNFTHVMDIVDGLMLVAESGKGDGYGIGADESYAIVDIASKFGGEVVMMPERKGNRMNSGVDNGKVKSLGWKQKHQLATWIQAVVAEAGEVQKSEQRILVFSPTFLPNAGAAELALYDVCAALPNVQFDIITTKFGEDMEGVKCNLQNVSIHRVGNNSKFDKFLLPFSGAALAKKLEADHGYLFRWSLFASYGALAALLSKPTKKTPLLITLADQKMASVSWYTRVILRHLLGQADQIYAMDTYEAQAAISVSKRTTLIKSIGKGDAFANQIRFTYANFLQARLEKE